MTKQRLLTSVAAAALFAAPGLGDTEISSATTTPLTTGALLTSGSGTANAGNITIETSDSIKISTESIGVITIDTSNYLYSNGTLKNSGVSTAYGIHIDVASNPVLTSTAFTNNASSTITGAGIYLDASSVLDLSGDGSGKYAVYFDSSYGSGTYTGDVILNGGTITVEGASSYGFYFGSNTTFKGDLSLDSGYLTMSDGSSYGLYFASGSTFTGDLTLGSGSYITMSDNSNVAIYVASGSTFTGDIVLDGSIVLHQETARSTSSSSLQAVLMAATLTGDFTVNGSITSVGAGATGILLEGTGISGAVTIGGTVETIGYSSTYDTNTSVYSKSISTYPEASSALMIGVDIDNGVMISGSPSSGVSSSYTGSVVTDGTGTTLIISPSVNSVATQSSDLTIGVYKLNGDYDTYDPGFSFYNRGSITATPMNYNASAAALYTVGNSVYHTVLTGGFYNSGTIIASAVTNTNKNTVVTASAVSIGAYTYLDNATYNTTTDTWADLTMSTKNSSDQAAFVNSNVAGSGEIAAVVSCQSSAGCNPGSAVALSIAEYASVPSLINSGTISAEALSADKTLSRTISSSNTYTLYAVAIYDGSGTLTSIYNTGTISAIAGVGTTSSTTITDLDNDKQLAVAIDLSSGNTATPSGSGVTITDYATASSAAIIYGNIYFGTGDNQVINVQGTSTTYTASIIGDIAYGDTGTNAIADTLQIGAYGIVKGKITAGSGTGLNVNVASNGVLYMLNDTTALNAASVHVADSGTISIGVSESLTSKGAIASKGTVILDKGSNLELSYNSFIPQGTNSYTLITAPYGDIRIDTSTISVTNTYLTQNMSSGGYLPFLFSSASLSVTSSSSNGDALVLTVTPKTSVQLGLKGYAAQLFGYVNTALATDNDLGAAMIYGIHNAAEAQTAYSSFGPIVSGGDRALAVAITDQATGAVAARQRSLLMFARTESGTSMWADEYVQMIKDPGRGAEAADGVRELSGFRHHGFGISVGIDTGTPKYGWYGGALTFYAGDVNELNRTAQTHQQWLLLTGYSVWRGKGLFFNSKLDLGYGQFQGSRMIALTTASTSTTDTVYSRTADNKHEGALLSGGFATGLYLNYGGAVVSPTFAVDGLLMRENGYLEYNPGTASSGDAFDLEVQPYYARSLRAFFGVDLRYDLSLWDVFLQPELRAGYRYDFFTDPQKLKVAFAYADTSGCTSGTFNTTCATAGDQFTIAGPDPAKGSLVLGGSLAATTDAWTLGLHFDFLRGANGVIQEVGTLSVVGKI